MAQVHIDEPDDGRLSQLLAVEQRLRDRVAHAREKAARRIAAAHAAHETRLDAARHAAEQTDADQATTERLEHETALAAIENATGAAIAAVERLPDGRIDDLARWALVQAIGGEGEDS